MNTSGNISLFSGTVLGGGGQVNGNGLFGPGLTGFTDILGMLLLQPAAPAGAENPAAPAPLLPQAPAAAETKTADGETLQTLNSLLELLQKAAAPASVETTAEEGSVAAPETLIPLDAVTNQGPMEEGADTPEAPALPETALQARELLQKITALLLPQADGGNAPAAEIRPALLRGPALLQTAPLLPAAEAAPELPAGAAPEKPLQALLHAPAPFAESAEKIAAPVIALPLAPAPEEKPDAFLKDIVRFLKAEGFAPEQAEKFAAAAEKVILPAPGKTAAPAAAPAAAPQPQVPVAQASAQNAVHIPAPQNIPETAADIRIQLLMREQQARVAPQETVSAPTAQDTPAKAAQRALPQTVPAAAQPQVDATPAAARPQAQAAPHISLVNAFAPGDGEAEAEGWQFRQDGYVQQGETGLARAASDAAAPAGFARYLSAAAAAPQAHVTQMVSLQMQKNAAARVESMTLQLEPADLGRLEIRMDFEKDGSLRAHLTADKPETLSMLQRDAAHLHRALHQAGFDLDDAALSFDLRDQGQDRQQDLSDANRNDRPAARTGGGTEDTTAAAPAAWQGTVTPRGVNIMV